MTTELPPEALEVARQERNALPRRTTPDEATIRDLAALLHPDNAADRHRYSAKHHHHLHTQAYSGDDDALLDTLRTLHQQRERIDRATRLLLAYARTSPAVGAPYRLRDLADAAGVSISSARSMWDETTVAEIARLLHRGADEDPQGSESTSGT